MSTTQPLKIGELLVRQGVMTEEQVSEVLEHQQATGRPFGLLAEQLFDVNPDAVEKAWVEQYLSYETEVDLESQHIDVEVLKVINRRQAWQFRILPVQRDESTHEMIAVTSKEFLRRAVNFAWRQVNDPVYFLVARRPQLEEFLMKHYPWPGALDIPVSADHDAA